MMKALLERQIYRPGLVLPMMGLTRLLVRYDFNLTQVGFVMALHGSRLASSFVFRGVLRVPSVSRMSWKAVGTRIAPVGSWVSQMSVTVAPRLIPHPVAGLKRLGRHLFTRRAPSVKMAKPPVGGGCHCGC
jgi:hypothetical protein